MRISLRRFICFIVLGILTFTLGSACSKTIDYKATGDEQPLEHCRVVQHAAGQTCIPINPQRVVTLDRISFSTAIALGIKPIATIDYTSTEYDAPYITDKIEGITFIPSARGQPNLEKILLLQPDLIISNSSFQDVYQQSSQIAATVLVPFPATNQSKWQDYLTSFAEIFDRTDIANRLLSDYNQRIKFLKQALGDDRQQISVSFILASFGQIYAGSKNSFVGKILNDLGFRHSSLQPSSYIAYTAYIAISEEVLPDIDSDILFIVAHREEDEQILEQLQNKPLWSELKAVQNDRVYQVKSYVWDGRNIFAAYAVLDDIEKYLVNTP
jgi:iron complex transport system substrate-binding protein